MMPHNMVYLPRLTDARFVKMYFFRHPQLGPCSCVLVTDCKSGEGPQYSHVMYVYEKGDFITGRPSLAVASEVNRIARPGSGRSHFLGVFRGPPPKHENLGASDDWADLEKFSRHALEVVAQHFGLPKPPEEIPVPTIMLQKFQLPHSYLLEDHASQARKV